MSPNISMLLCCGESNYSNTSIEMDLRLPLCQVWYLKKTFEMSTPSFPLTAEENYG